MGFLAFNLPELLLVTYSRVMVSGGETAIPCKAFSLWADSFHEGEWACRAVADMVSARGGTFKAAYKQGFIPEFTYVLDGDEFRVTVYGNYASWDPQPEPLSSLLAWGKPDLVLMREDNDEILFAVEETAATPTGNQALQRCERQFGAAREGFPFWYLISEFGIHPDGGVRRDSIWPTLMGLELMSATQVPSIVLHYSDASNPEDYSSGKGMNSLFLVFLRVLVNVVEAKAPLSGLDQEIKSQISRMVEFVESTWSSSLYLVPDLTGLDTKWLSHQLCSTSQTAIAGTNNAHSNFLVWPTVGQLTKGETQLQQARPLIKHDPFAQILERDLLSGLSYGVIKGVGSKPQKRASLQSWIISQNTKHSVWQESANRPEAIFELEIDDFPVTAAGNHHVITAQRILYLYDSAEDVQASLKEAFPYLESSQLFLEEDLTKPALVYISNSVKPGRIFGDPYTGQLSAYSVSFGALSGNRKVIAYFPHQSVSQAAAYLSTPNNKGLRMFAELTDLLVFGGGVSIKTKTLELL